MKFRVWFEWHCKKAGGLLLGVQYHFPCHILLEDDSLVVVRLLTVGLLVGSVKIEISRRIR